MFTAKQLENKTSYNLKHTEHSSFLGFIVTEHGEGAKLLNKLILFLFLFDRYMMKHDDAEMSQSNVGFA